MGNLSGFNAHEVEPEQAFGPLPAGWYTAMIVDSTMKPTKAGTGEYLELRLDIIDGEHEGRVVFDRLNLNNPNSVAVEIAQRTLSSICHATGVMQPNDSSDLHNIPMQIKLAISPATDRYDASNDVKGYKPAGKGAPAPKAPAAAAPAQPAPAVAAAPAAAPAAGKKPWEQ